ncbi:type I-U CRISPR-associated protein Cas7 [Thiorhodococcus mannitoliphagus]|uniref:Type I-U CRISPR-associated protein Cas7 n=1 Tax=Thiorhodococcus mannitoliphagus TaxID=329406 RepID=A0A6P1DQ63_9GAMM|nr:type I-U CRISPR-associated RAMP protein Csb1/Cas7u [Thiorhodococcus mannitoliphagus]NEX19071.1 type I-U CRISPR-associated protein Cas7 [Thiorhodococcus mannitoliphagus]
MQLSTIITTPEIVAITMRRTLAPLDGADVPIFPPTYPPPERGQHRFETPYTVNQLRDGTLIADLDSVQSQANRMEAAFSGPLADRVPQHTVVAGDHSVPLSELPHRIADAAARATDLRDQIRAAMLAYAAGDPAPVAQLCPTALVYGAWDSRDTRINIPRAIRSEIRAHDISIATRSAQFTGTFDAEELELNATEWKKGANIGFAPTPSVNAHGGIYVHGEIIHTASISLSPLRRAKDSVLSAYLLGLALAGLLHAMRETRLRVGCELIPEGPTQWQLVNADGQKKPLEVTTKDIEAQLGAAATAWATAAGVTLGGPAVHHQYDPKAGKAAIKAAEKSQD